MIGLHVRSGVLYFNEQMISNSTGSIGLNVRPNRDLYFNDEKISSGDMTNPIGLVYLNNVLSFDGLVVGSGTTPPDPSDGEFSAEGYWIPPAQPANTDGQFWSYATILSKYDQLVAIEPRLTKHRYNDSQGNALLSNAGGYELYHYKYEPVGYDKTIYMQANIHGNEKDSRLTLYRMMQILFTMRTQEGYLAWQQIYNRCRLIIIPCANPNGNDQTMMNIPYKDSQYGLNPNRNMDYNHQAAIPSSGVGGDTFFDVNETRHIRDTANLYGAKNIDFAIDFHDGAEVAQHYWINYAVDAPNRVWVNNFVNYMLNKHGIAPQDAIIPNCKDTYITGLVSSWFNKTMGVTASTSEWMGGIFGYDFSSAHMTHSLELRANTLFMALNNDFKGWQIREPANASYFHFNYPKAFTRDSLRKEEAAAETKVSDAMIVARWNKLLADNPTKLSKSAVLGVNATGLNIHSYTFGTGAKKVIYVGGVMRYGATHLIDEYAIYQLVEYLCDDYIVNQSVFLTDLRDNYTIVVLPFIDNIATNADPYTGAGLNNVVLSRQRWVEVSGVTQPATGVNGADNYGVRIIKALIDANTGAKCIVSGGEIMTGYSFNQQDLYTTDYQTHIAIPKRQVFSKQSYKTHLETNRSELVIVQPTDGFTFADYAYDNHAIPSYFVQIKVSDRFTELANDHTLTEDQYIYFNYEAGRRMANIVNLFVS